MMTIGERIRAARKAKGMTQRELAERTGYTSRSTIAKIEAGVNDIPSSQVATFADALGCTAAYLMGQAAEVGGRKMSNCYAMCGDNRFEIIAKAKADLLKSTNIAMRADEMACLDSFLFRCWQMGWLDGYETVSTEEE